MFFFLECLSIRYAQFPRDIIAKRLSRLLSSIVDKKMHQRREIEAGSAIEVRRRNMEEIVRRDNYHRIVLCMKISLRRRARGTQLRL